MSREDPQMKIRLPADLKDQIEAASKNSGRSMNAEIVARLGRSFSTPDLVPPENKSEQQQMREAQISVVLAGLSLAEMATDFVELEVPTVKDSQSFPKLQQTISVLQRSMAHELTEPNVAYATAIKSLAGLKEISDDLGIARMVAALRKNNLTDPHDQK